MLTVSAMCWLSFKMISNIEALRSLFQPTINWLHASHTWETWKSRMIVLELLLHSAVFHLPYHYSLGCFILTLPLLFSTYPSPGCNFSRWYILWWHGMLRYLPVLNVLVGAPYQAPLHVGVSHTSHTWLVNQSPRRSRLSFLLLSTFSLSVNSTHGQQLHLTCHQRSWNTRLGTLYL